MSTEVKSKNWNINSAILYLTIKGGAEINSSKKLIHLTKNGLTGLNACSAYDFLMQHHGFKLAMSNLEV